MLFKFPKNDKTFSWTSHVKNKMLHYRISEQKIKTILKNPNREEEGIAPKTLAVMKRNDASKRKEELWVMFQKNGDKIKVISAWRYPGVSPKSKEIPIPEDILQELENQL